MPGRVPSGPEVQPTEVPARLATAGVPAGRTPAGRVPASRVASSASVLRHCGGEETDHAQQNRKDLRRPHKEGKSSGHGFTTPGNVGFSLLLMGMLASADTATRWATRGHRRPHRAGAARPRVPRDDAEVPGAVDGEGEAARGNEAAVLRRFSQAAVAELHFDYPQRAKPRFCASGIALRRVKHSVSAPAVFDWRNILASWQPSPQSSRPDALHECIFRTLPPLFFGARMGAASQAICRLFP